MVIDNARTLRLAQLINLRGRSGAAREASHLLLLYHEPLGRDVEARAQGDPGDHRRLPDRGGRPQLRATVTCWVSGKAAARLPRRGAPRCTATDHPGPRRGAAHHEGDNETEGARGEACAAALSVRTRRGSAAWARDDRTGSAVSVVPMLARRVSAVLALLFASQENHEGRCGFGPRVRGRL